MSEQAPAPIRIPKPLSTWKVVAFSLLLPVCVTLVTTASVGLWVLTGETFPGQHSEALPFARELLKVSVLLFFLFLLLF